MLCQARVLNQEFTIPGTTEKCHTTKECNMAFFKKVTIDEDNMMHACKDCLKRYMTKKSENVWYGWFDCDHPPGARVKGSAWYDSIVKSQKIPKASAKNEKETIKNKIKEIKESLKGADRKTQIAKYNEIMQLTIKLKML